MTADMRATAWRDWRGWLVLEVVLTCGAFTSAMVWFVLWTGGTISGDFTNQQLYLGWQGLYGSRLAWDYFAVGASVCQYPLGYMPLAAMVDAGWTGDTIFAVLAVFASLSVPAVWLTAWCVLPGTGARAAALRIAGTVLACTGTLYWRMLVSTSNDFAGTVPELWAVALALLCLDEARWKNRPRWRLSLCALAGGLAGLGLVVKITQVIGVLAAAVVLLFMQGHWKTRLGGWLCFGLGVLAMFIAVGGHWALESWVACGSPVHPLLLDFFSAHKSWAEMLR